MNRKITIFAAALVTLLLTLGFFSQRPVAAQEGRQVWAYYMGWWTNESWGSGLLTDRPAQLYDSRDGGALGRQIEQAQSAGIDAFIVSWFGPKNDNLTNQNFNLLLDQAAARGFRIGVTIDMYQSDYNANVAEITESLNYIINDRANHPAYLRYGGKPVIYFWNQARLSVAEWSNLRNQLDPNRNTIWVSQGTSTSYIGPFDGLYLFNTAWSGNPASTAATFRTRVANAGGTFYSPTVVPGWDETLVAASEGRTGTTSPQARADGAFLTRSWNGAASSGSNVILIVSWNEYFENSHIEPSVNYGTQALDILRPLIAAWESGAPVGSVAAGSAPATSGGTVVTPNVQLNVRTEPSATSPRIGRINPGESYAVTGEANGWYAINYNGQTGYVSGAYVTVSNGAHKGTAVKNVNPWREMIECHGQEAWSRQLMEWRFFPNALSEEKYQWFHQTQSTSSREATLDLATLRYPAVSDELWIQHLRTNQLEVVALGGGGIQEARLEDYVVSGLVDFDDISYDDHADLLYDLAAQTVQHFRTYLSEDDTRKVLRCWTRLNCPTSRMRKRFCAEMSPKSRSSPSWMVASACVAPAIANPSANATTRPKRPPKRAFAISFPPRPASYPPRSPPTLLTTINGRAILHFRRR